MKLVLNVVLFSVEKKGVLHTHRGPVDRIGEQHVKRVRELVAIQNTRCGLVF